MTKAAFSDTVIIDDSPKVDIIEHELKCLGCDKLILLVAEADLGVPIETKFRAICPCGDHSKILSVNGKPYLQCPDGLTFKDQVLGDVVEITIGAI